MGRRIPLFARTYPLGYNLSMIEIRQTEVYANWFARLRDRQARARMAGGDKRTQDRDIQVALELARQM
jgi:putative component of toxin-antitoxin plasmid stabilization module